MIEWLYRIVILLVVIVIIMVSNNILVYRQVETFKRLLAFWVISLSTLFIGTVVLMLSFFERPTGTLGAVIGIVDAPFSAFVGYLPKMPLLIWFLGPVAIVWVYFLIRGQIAFLRKKHKYQAYLDEKEAKAAKQQDKADDKEVPESVESVTSPDVESPKEVQESPVPPAAPVQPEQPVEAPLPEEAQPAAPVMPVSAPSTDALDVPTQPLDFSSREGIMTIFHDAHSRLLVDKHESGYIAVYLSAAGYQQIKQLFSLNSIDLSGVSAKPSVVLFDQNHVQSYDFQTYIQQLNKGGVA